MLLNGVVACFVMLLPFGLALTWLTLALVDWTPEIPILLLYIIVDLAILLPISLILAAKIIDKTDQPLELMALLSPCFMAPLSVLHIWALVPGNLGIGEGGFEFFLGWLVKYPNFGPVNLDILLGILAVLGTGVMPVIFGLYFWYTKKRSDLLLRLLSILFLIPFFAVFFVLDLGLWYVGLNEMWEVFDSATDHMILYGPIMRSLPLISIGILVFKPEAFSRHWR